MSVIRIRDLVKQYDGLRALDGVDLDLPRQRGKDPLPDLAGDHPDPVNHLTAYGRLFL